MMPLNTKKLRDLAISETGLVFDPSTGYIYTANQAGVFIITRLKSGATREDLPGLVMEEFEADEGMVERDIFDFMNQLITLELISDE
jgi:hypothetical protein